MCGRWREAGHETPYLEHHRPEKLTPEDEGSGEEGGEKERKRGEMGEGRSGKEGGEKEGKRGEMGEGRSGKEGGWRRRQGKGERKGEW